MGERNAGGLRKASIVLSGLLLVGLWPATALAGGPVDLAGPDVGDAIEGATQTVEETVEKVPDVTDQVTDTVDKTVDGATGAVEEVTNDAGGTVDKVVDGATGAVDNVVDGAAGAVDKVTNDGGGALDQAAGTVDKGAKDASQATGGNAGGGAATAGSVDGSGNESRRVRQHSSGGSDNGKVKARSVRVRQEALRARGDHFAALAAAERARDRAREGQPGRPDNPLVGLIDAGNEIGDQVEASATGQPSAPRAEQPVSQGSGLPFTGGFALLLALAYATLFCCIGSALLAGTKSRGPSEFRLLS